MNIEYINVPKENPLWKNNKSRKCNRNMNEEQWAQDECAWTCKQKCPYDYPFEKNEE